MKLKDRTYIPREAKQMDLKMYIEKYSNVITVEIEDKDTEEITYFSLNTEKVEKMIEERGFFDEQ